MIIFSAEDINAAKIISQKDPLFNNGAYRYELYE